MAELTSIMVLTLIPRITDAVGHVLFSDFT